MVNGLGRADCIWYSNVYLYVMACVLYQILISSVSHTWVSYQFCAVCVPNPCSVIHLE